MEIDKKKRLQAKGWRVGSAAELLELRAEEAAQIGLRLTLADSVARLNTRTKTMRTSASHEAPGLDAQAPSPSRSTPR